MFVKPWRIISSDITAIELLYSCTTSSCEISQAECSYKETTSSYRFTFLINPLVFVLPSELSLNLCLSTVLGSTRIAQTPGSIFIPSIMPHLLTSDPQYEVYLNAEFIFAHYSKRVKETSMWSNLARFLCLRQHESIRIHLTVTSVPIDKSGIVTIHISGMLKGKHLKIQVRLF